MINGVRYYLLLLIDWKISLLQRFKKIISGESKYEISDSEWLEKHKKWKERND
jgi:hypothetical protein